MDGSLVASRFVIETEWRRWARRHSIDWDTLHHALLGVPTHRHWGDEALKFPDADLRIEDLNSFDIGLASSGQIAFLTVL